MPARDAVSLARWYSSSASSDSRDIAKRRPRSTWAVARSTVRRIVPSSVEPKRCSASSRSPLGDQQVRGPDHVAHREVRHRARRGVATGLLGLVERALPELGEHDEAHASSSPARSPEGGRASGHLENEVDAHELVGAEQHATGSRQDRLAREVAHHHLVRVEHRTEDLDDVRGRHTGVVLEAVDIEEGARGAGGLGRSSEDFAKSVSISATPSLRWAGWPERSVRPIRTRVAGRCRRPREVGRDLVQSATPSARSSGQLAQRAHQADRDRDDDLVVEDAERQRLLEGRERRAQTELGLALGEVEPHDGSCCDRQPLR
jgi:hypothetical protein